MGVLGDYDNDGDLDLALAGYGSSGKISKIYRNNEGAFEDIGASLEGVYDCSLSWGDYDNDGDLDLALAGYSGSSRISKIYKSTIANTIPNTAPQVPSSGFLAEYSTETWKIEYRWDKSSDVETPQNGLYYEVRVATEPVNESLTNWIVSPSVGGAGVF